MSVHEHRHNAPRPEAVRVAILTVSDTRTAETDKGGAVAVELCQAAGLSVAVRDIVRDEAPAIAAWVKDHAASGAVDALLLTGGTGLSGRDSTVEAVSPLFDRTLPGYGELFRALSFAEVGPAAMLSRAQAGAIGRAIVFLMPGSPAGVRLALERLILPELPHIVAELRRHPRGHGHG